MNNKAIFPGTFDPITNGHLDLITRASRLFSQIVVAVAINPNKTPLFSLAERMELIQDAVNGLPNVQVMSFQGLLVDFAKAQNASIMLRGVRGASDFEYEFQLAGMNRKLSENIETLFLTPSESLIFISSSLVREVNALGGEVAAFVPKGVADALLKR